MDSPRTLAHALSARAMHRAKDSPLLMRLHFARERHRGRHIVQQWGARMRWGAMEPAAPSGAALTSQLCTQASIESPWFPEWCAAFREQPAYNRKLWEWAWIAQALQEQGVLVPGSRGVGYGVGREPLVAAFARRGCLVTATDQGTDEAEWQGWSQTGFHSSNIEQLNPGELCPESEFRERVRLMAVDMNALPAGLRGFDFCWSACAFEHLGTLEHGLRFVEASVELLRPGGVAVHTTEFNLSSNEETVDNHWNVIYRRRDLEGLVDRLTAQGHQVLSLDLRRGNGILDGLVDLPPFRYEPHLRIVLYGHIVTSVGLIIRRAQGPTARKGSSESRSAIR